MNSAPDKFSDNTSNRLVRRIGRGFFAAWRPNTLPRPMLDPYVDQLSTVERIAEVLRYNMLTLEHAVSPQGGLRAWLKMNLLIGIAVAIPAIIVVPVVTYLLSGFADWTTFLRQIAENLMFTAVSITGTVLAVIIGGKLAIRLLRKR